MHTRFLAFFLACLSALCVTTPSSQAADRGEEQPPISLQSKVLNDLTKSYRVFVDATGLLTPDEIVKTKLPLFTQGQEQPMHPGYTSDRYWLSVIVRNASDNSEWFLMPDYPLLDFEAYEIEGDSIKPLPAEVSEARYPVRTLNLKPGEERQLLLQVWSPLVVNLQFKIMTATHFKKHTTSDATLVGILAGIFLAMIIYNLFLFANLRDRDYFFYILFALVNTHLNLLSADFPAGVYQWFSIDWWQYIDVYRPLAPFTTLLFARSFLQTKTEHKTLDRVIVIYLVGLLGFMAASFFVPRHMLFLIEDSYFLIAIVLLFAAGIQSLRRGFKPSHFYLVGLTLFLVGMGIYIAKSEGLLATNALTLNAHLVFQAGEMLLMSLALSGKIKQLEQHKTQAEVTAKVKGRLLRVISHDIANPLGIVKGMAYILKSEKIDPVRVDAITRAVLAIEEIMTFVHKTESLDSSSPLQTETVSLNEVFDGLEFLFQKLADDKKIRLRFDLEHPQMYVQGEKTSLTYEILGNFVGNSIKFTREGGEVSIRARTVGQMIQVIVSDDGIGMSERAVAAAFDPTINVSRRGTAGEKGGGYGLLLAKAYIDQFGASVTIESVPHDLNSDRSGTKIIINFQTPGSNVSSRSFRQRWRIMQ